ncbi:hypothetical protein D3C78_592380 [compost metagenome]
MAHVGQELRLDPAGLQRLLACHIQLNVLDFNGLQVLTYVFCCLVDAVLQFFVGALQGFGHAIDASGQLIHLMATHYRQAFFQVAVLELGHCMLDLADRAIDRAGHAQGQQGGGKHAEKNQQQAGEQAAVTA